MVLSIFTQHNGSPALIILAVKPLPLDGGYKAIA